MSFTVPEPVIDNSDTHDNTEPKAQGIALVIMLVVVLPYIMLSSYLTSTVSILQQDSAGHSFLSQALPNLGILGNLALYFIPATALAIFVTGANGQASSRHALKLSIVFAAITVTGICLSFIPA